MKITGDIRKYDDEMGLAEGRSLSGGVDEDSKEFVDGGPEVCTRTRIGPWVHL